MRIEPSRVLLALVVCLGLTASSGCAEDGTTEDPVADAGVGDAVSIADGAALDVPHDGLDDVVDDVDEPDQWTDATDAEAEVEVAMVPIWSADPLTLGEEFVLRGVWGQSPDSLVAVGNKSTIIEYDGSDWKVVYQNTELDTLNAVWGSGPDDIWAVGALGAILHKGEAGWSIGTACSNDAACDDADPCTVDTCGTDGQCIYEGSGSPGCCGSVAIDENFESGLTWTVVDTSQTQTGVVWQVVAALGPDGTPRATSGTHALYFGNPDAPCPTNDGTLCPDFDGGDVVAAEVTSGSISLPEAGAVTATFQVFLDGESSGSYDKLDLWVVPDVGEPVLVWTKDSVGGDTAGVFVPASADLTAFAGQVVQVRFAFDSVDSLSNNGEGAYVDDFRIDTTCGAVGEARFPTLWDIWGMGPDNVYAVGNQGIIVHWDGQSWKVQLGGESNDMYAVTGDAVGLVAGGATGEVITNFGGGLSSDKAATGTIQGLTTEADGSTLAVGDGGLVSTRTEDGWTAGESGTTADLFGAWAGENLAMAVGRDGTIVHRTDGTWAPVESATTTTLYDVWGAGDDIAWAVGEKSGDKTVVTAWDGSQWAEQSLNKLNYELRAITGFDGGDLLIAVGGGGTIVEVVDGVWNKTESPTTFALRGVWGSGSDRVWAVGNIGTILERVDGTWSAVLDTPTKVTLYDVWGRDDSDVYAVGQGGAMLRWDGTEWILLRSSTTAALRGIWGSGPDDIYAVGSQATIMHFDGLYWSQVKVQDELHGEELVPVTDQLFDVWGRHKDDIYAVGANGTIIHLTLDEQSGVRLWVKEPQPDLTVTLRGVTGDDTQTWAVGRTGTLMNYQLGQLSPETSGTIATLYDVIAFADGELIAVGDLGTVIRRQLVPAR